MYNDNKVKKLQAHPEVMKDTIELVKECVDAFFGNEGLNIKIDSTMEYDSCLNKDDTRCKIIILKDKTPVLEISYSSIIYNNKIDNIEPYPCLFYPVGKDKTVEKPTQTKLGFEHEFYKAASYNLKLAKKGIEVF